jgi:L-ribulose-5-phosphate 4-epimerase
MLHEEARKALLKCALRLYQKGLVQLNSGNVSVRVSDEHLVITPTGISYDDMSEEDLVIIDFNGGRVEGKHKPSSETPMHTTVYKNIDEVKAIAHTHSPFALAFATVGRSIPVISTEGLAVRGPIPVADYACPGTEAQGRAAIKAMKGPPYVMGTLLKNHGVLVTGASLSHAYSMACRIEMAAKVFFLALQIGEPDVLTDDQIKEIRTVYRRK